MTANTGAVLIDVCWPALPAARHFVPFVAAATDPSDILLRQTLVIFYCDALTPEDRGIRSIVSVASHKRA